MASLALETGGSMPTTLALATGWLGATYLALVWWRRSQQERWREVRRTEWAGCVYFVLSLSIVLALFSVTC